jgi:hypothetical protein
VPLRLLTARHLGKTVFDVVNGLNTTILLIAFSVVGKAQTLCRLHIANTYGQPIVAESVLLTQGDRKVQISTDSLGNIATELRDGRLLVEAAGFEPATVERISCGSLTMIALKLGRLFPEATSLDVEVELPPGVKGPSQKFLRMTHLVSGKSVVDVLHPTNRITFEGSFSGVYDVVLFDSRGVLGQLAVSISSSANSTKLRFR